MTSIKQTSTILNIAAILFTFSVINLNSLYAQSGWFHQQCGSEVNLKSVSFVSSATGWAVGDNTILATSNGGLNWIGQQFLETENDYYSFNSVCFVNSLTGWVTGDLTVNPPGSHFDVILKTTNGGINWIEKYRDFRVGLTSVYFINSTTGFTVGYNVIVMTTNGGQSWITEYLPWTENSDYSLKSVCFTNSMTGWAVGKLSIGPGEMRYNVIFKTNNGGLNWAEQYRNDGLGLTSVYFSNQVIGWAAGYGEILRTTNGGINWDSHGFGSENCDFNFKSVHFANTLTGWVVGGSYCMPGNVYTRKILKTNNCGINWTEQSYPAENNNYLLNSVFFTNETTGWVVGDGGIILRTTDGGLTSINPSGSEIPNSYSLYQNYPNPFNPNTNIKFSIPEPGKVKLVVFDITGKQVAELVNGNYSAGTYKVDFDASKLSSGLYLYKIITDSFTETKKMILVK